MVRAIARLSMACAVVAAFVPTVATASPPTPLPSDDILGSLRRETQPSVNDLAHAMRLGPARAESCDVEEGRFVCSCVVWQSQEATLRFGTLRDGGVAKNVWIERGEETLFVAEMAPGEDGVAVSDLVWANGEVVVRAAGGLVGDVATFDDVRWHETGAPTAGCDVTPPAETGTPYARAAAVTRDEDGWSAVQLRVGPWPVGSGAIDRPASGVLPPTVRASPVGGELQGDYWIAPFGSILVAADVAGRFGAGVGVTSQRQSELRRLDLLAYVDIEDGLVPVGSGDVSLGEKLHLRGHLEHPTDSHASSLRAFERGALFREWGVSRLGLSLSGDGHVLQMRGGVVTDPNVPDPRWEGDLAYGLTFARQRHSVWRFDLQHQTVEQDDTIHSSIAAVSWRGPFGRTSRAWVTPGVDVVANYGTVTARRGFDASTTVSALASVDAGLALEGRFERARHRIVPRVRAGAEVLGVQQRQPEEGAPPYPYTAPDRWRWGLVSLEQVLTRGGWSVQLPVGVFADVLGDESPADLADTARGFTRLDVRYGDVSAGGAATCGLSCETPRFHFAARVSPGRRARAWYSAGNMGARELAIAWSDLLLGEPIPALRLVQTRSSPETAAQFAHLAGFELRHGRASWAVQGSWGDTEASRGVGSRAGLRWDELGWGIGVGGGWQPFAGEWNAVAGLTWSSPR